MAEYSCNCTNATVLLTVDAWCSSLLGSSKVRLTYRVSGYSSWSHDAGTTPLRSRQTTGFGPIRS